VKDVLDRLDDVRVHNVPDVVKVHLTHNTRTRDTPHVVSNLQDTHLLIQNNVVGKHHAEVLRPCKKKNNNKTMLILTTKRNNLNIDNTLLISMIIIVLRPCEKKQQQNKVNFNYKEKQTTYK
jgi:hypothetical protein